MYEGFTDRSRKVMQLANQEAKKLCHEYVGTEHILLGLTAEHSGVAVSVLRNMDIDIDKVRTEVVKIVQAGPDMVVMGKLPLTPRAKQVIEYAIAEAKELDHHYIGTEHLLLGLLRVTEGTACQVLISLGATVEGVREEVLRLLGTSKKEEEKAAKGMTLQEAEFIVAVVSEKYSGKNTQILAERHAIREAIVSRPFPKPVSRVVAEWLARWYGQRSQDA